MSAGKRFAPWSGVPATTSGVFPGHQHGIDRRARHAAEPRGKRWLHTEPSNVRWNADGLMLQEGTPIPDSTDHSISPSPGGIRVYRAGFHSGRDSANPTGRFPDDLGFGRDFHDQAVAPAVLRVGQRLDRPGKLRLTLIVHEPGGSLEPPLADT